MKSVRLVKKTFRILALALLTSLASTLAGNSSSLAQSLPQISSSPTITAPESSRDDSETAVASKPGNKGATEVAPARHPREAFRVERISLPNGAELLTIFARVQGGSGTTEDVPLVSVVRDTLGDEDPTNDRLRYVWMLTYAKPTLRQRLASAVPFLYKRVANKTRSSDRPPPILLNISSARQKAWSNVLWFGVQHFVLDTHGIAFKAATRAYRRNWSDYHDAHVTQALAVLSMYEKMRPQSENENETIASLQTTTDAAPNSELRANTILTSGPSRMTALPTPPPVITIADTIELRARLMLSEKTFGGFARPDKFPHVVEKQTIDSRDDIGHNWELLRQGAEMAGLYFEPLKMPDGTATHALLWISKSDLTAQPYGRPEFRFLNIANPWNDKRLRDWHGYTKLRYFDADDHLLSKSVPGARAVEMIPLAVYGLDNPKIPTLLVDFRDGLNPKKREISHRIIRDVTTNILSLSAADVTYFLGHRAFDWITSRRGIDINQPSRLRSYSQLKLLLSLNSEVDSRLRLEIEQRLEAVSHDPLANDRVAEIQLARQQYGALVGFTQRRDGLVSRIERDRRAEMTPLQHGRTAQFLFRLGSVFTFGRYVHRETATPELMARMDVSRRLEYHSRFLREVATSTPRIEVTWNLADVRRSLEFVAANAAAANGSTAKAAAKVFARTEDDQTRRLCLDALYKIKGKTAKNELLQIYRDPETSAEWRATVADYLRRAVMEDPKITPAEAKALLDQVSGK